MRALQIEHIIPLIFNELFVVAAATSQDSLARRSQESCNNERCVPCLTLCIHINTDEKWLRKQHLNA